MRNSICFPSSLRSPFCSLILHNTMEHDPNVAYRWHSCTLITQGAQALCFERPMICVALRGHVNQISCDRKIIFRIQIAFFADVICVGPLITSTKEARIQGDFTKLEILKSSSFRAINVINQEIITISKLVICIGNRMGSSKIKD
jgi:hypothetical protein